MNLEELPDILERQIDYPADLSAVRDRIGGTRVDAPDCSDTRTIGELLSYLDADTYESSEELFDAILSSLPDDYIGRKFYDDRGWNPVEEEGETRTDRERRDRSF